MHQCHFVSFKFESMLATPEMAYMRALTSSSSSSFSSFCCSPPPFILLLIMMMMIIIIIVNIIITCLPGILSLSPGVFLCSSGSFPVLLLLPLTSLVFLCLLRPWSWVFPYHPALSLSLWSFLVFLGRSLSAWSSRVLLGRPLALLSHSVQRKLILRWMWAAFGKHVQSTPACPVAYASAVDIWLGQRDTMYPVSRLEHREHFSTKWNSFRFCCCCCRR